jgi:hypothetical protein
MFTYKSTSEIDKALTGIGLYRLSPCEEVDDGRLIYVMGDLLQTLSETENTHVGWRHVEARDFLDGFSLGDSFSVSQHPHAKPAFVQLSRVHPIDKEVWSFRCLAPRPGMRILGRFAAKDCFVALGWDYRENLDSDQRWTDLANECVNQWRTLFSDNPPHQGKHVDDYLSSNFKDVPANPRRKGSLCNS